MKMYSNNEISKASKLIAIPMVVLSIFFTIVPSLNVLAADKASGTPTPTPSSAGVEKIEVIDTPAATATETATQEPTPTAPDGKYVIYVTDDCEICDTLKTSLLSEPEATFKNIKDSATVQGEYWDAVNSCPDVKAEFPLMKLNGKCFTGAKTIDEAILDDEIASGDIFGTLSSTVTTTSVFKTSDYVIFGAILVAILLALYFFVIRGGKE